MHDNPAADWQTLAEHYRGLYDEELERLADEFADLTSTAQEVLRNEMKNRGLGDPIAPARKNREERAPVRFASNIEPNARGRECDPTSGETEDVPSEFTWKTPLCECETSEQAGQLYAALKRVGIDCWYSTQNVGQGGYAKLLVAADQLEQATEVAKQPIPQDILDELRERAEAPEYEAPRCPFCGAEDPVLESAEPTNSWLCEECGKQWSEPAVDERLG